MRKLIFVLYLLFAVFTSLMAGDYEELQKLVASDRATDDLFAFSASISGDYAIVGAYAEDEDASGNNTLNMAGSAYIFMRNGTSWDQQAKIVASDRDAYDGFGYSASISDDYAIVGAYAEDEDASGNNTLNMAGSAYIFMRNGTSWDQQAKIVASDRTRGDVFGSIVSISGDYAIVGVRDEDEDASGNNTLSMAGSAYIFMRNGTSWDQQAKIVASDRDAYDGFGHSVSISDDYAIVGARDEEQDASGNNTLEGAGSAYIFYRDGSTWAQQTKIVASDRAAGDRFGNSVSISGDYAIVGAPGEDEDASGNDTLTSAGSAYIFKRDGTSWSQQAMIVASDRGERDEFGNSVSISDDYAIVGAAHESEDASGNNTRKYAGSAYIFMREGTNWTQQAKIVASTRSMYDLFGYSASISGDYAIVGVPGEEEDASGNNYMASAGSAYIFSLHTIEDKITIPENDIPQEFSLNQNYPNPFNPTTTISYQLSAQSDVELSIFDINGKLVETLVNDHVSAGYYNVNWDVSNVNSGIYFYRLQAGDLIDTKKMVFMK